MFFFYPDQEYFIFSFLYEVMLVAMQQNRGIFGVEYDFCGVVAITSKAIQIFFYQ